MGKRGPKRGSRNKKRKNMPPRYKQRLDGSRVLNPDYDREYRRKTK